MKRSWSILLATLALCLALAPVWADPPADDDPAKPAQPADEDPAKPTDSDPNSADGEGDAQTSADATSPKNDASKKLNTLAEMEEFLRSKTEVFVTQMVLKFGPVLIGIVLLILLYLRNDKIRGGVLPQPLKREPTVPVKPGEALGLCLFGLVLLPQVIAFLLPASNGERPMWMSFLIMGLTFGPVAVIITLRRLRLARPFPPRFVKGVSLGAGAFCIALVVVLPVGLVWTLLLTQLGHPPAPQDLISKMVHPENPIDPYLIAAYGAIIAPFAEEAIFRGMLYPVGRRLLGDNRQGAIMSAVITSAMFAAIHSSATALVPLFALSLVLTWVMERTNSLTACVVAHALNNATTLIPLLMYQWV